MKNSHKELINKYGGKIVKFRNLPLPHKLAIIWYMSIDGSAWDYMVKSNTKKSLIESIPEYDKMYGNEKFGMVDIPTEVCKLSVMKKASMKDWRNDWESYHKWYLGNNGVENHRRKNAWACILSSFGDEFFEDGWHRFHRYCQLKMSSIPCICYV